MKYPNWIDLASYAEDSDPLMAGTECSVLEIGVQAGSTVPMTARECLPESLVVHTKIVPKPLTLEPLFLRYDQDQVEKVKFPSNLQLCAGLDIIWTGEGRYVFGDRHGFLPNMPLDMGGMVIAAAPQTSLFFLDFAPMTGEVPIELTENEIVFGSLGGVFEPGDLEGCEPFLFKCVKDQDESYSSLKIDNTGRRDLIRQAPGWPRSRFGDNKNVNLLGRDVPSLGECIRLGYISVALKLGDQLYPYFSTQARWMGQDHVDITLMEGSIWS